MSETPFTSLARSFQQGGGASVSMITAISELAKSWIGASPSSPGIIGALQATKSGTAEILATSISENPTSTTVPSGSIAANESLFKEAA